MIVPQRSRSVALLLVVSLCSLACPPEPFDPFPDPAVTGPLVDPDTSPLAPWPRDQTRLRFGVTPFIDERELRDAFQPLLEYLGEHLGVETSLVLAEDYADLGLKLKSQEVDLGQFTALSYVQAKRLDPGLRLIARQVADGAQTYIGYIYSNKDSHIGRLDDLAGKRMCYVDHQSTSGYMYPRAILRQHGLDPDHLFSEIEFAGNHLACMERVLSGESDASATYAGAFPIARSRGLEVHRLSVLAKTPHIPFNAYAVRSGLPETAARRIQQEFLHLSTRNPAGRLVLSRSMRLNAWVEAHDADYDSVRRALAASEGHGVAP